MSVDIFDISEAIAKITAKFEERGELLKSEIRTRTTNGASAMNAFGVPASASGATEESIQVIVEHETGIVEISLVGREGIMSLDEGIAPGGGGKTFDELLSDIEEWAGYKQAKYGLEPINAFSVASNVWSKGTILYREGGGIDIIKLPNDILIEEIEEIATEAINKAIYKVTALWAL